MLRRLNFLQIVTEDRLVVPYAAPIEWYVDWLGLQLGLTENIDSPVGKELNRCRIMGANRLQTLSVPIEGGSRNLRLPYDKIMVSEHGSWRRVHWGAIFSAYGRAPYFEHYQHLFQTIWAHPWSSLSALNNAIHRLISEIILPADIRQSLPHDIITLKSITDDYERYWQFNRTKDGFVGNLSALDMVFSLGPQAIFHLINALIKRNTAT